MARAFCFHTGVDICCRDGVTRELPIAAFSAVAGASGVAGMPRSVASDRRRGSDSVDDDKTVWPPFDPTMTSDFARSSQNFTRLSTPCALSKPGESVVLDSEGWFTLVAAPGLWCFSGFMAGLWCFSGDMKLTRRGSCVGEPKVLPGDIDIRNGPVPAPTEVLML